MNVYGPSYRCTCGHWNKRHSVTGLDIFDIIDGLIDMAAYERDPRRWGACTECDCAEFYRRVTVSKAYRATSSITSRRSAIR